MSSSGDLDFGLNNLASGIQIPTELESSVRRHQDNLRKLASTLKVSGVPQLQIEESINALVETYRVELLAAVRSLLGPIK